jgi:hypothetical protein
LVILFSACIILALLLLRSCDKADDFEDLYSASQDSLHKTVNKLGQETTKTALLYGEFDNFKKITKNTQDSILKRLGEMVDKNTISAIILQNRTRERGSSSTITTGRDTVIKNDTVFIYPEYSASWSERWSKGTIKANKDSVIRDIISMNEFEIKQKWERQKFLSPKQAIIEVLNKNPNTETVNLKSFTLKPPKRNTALKIAGGIGIGFLAGILLFK